MLEPVGAVAVALSRGTAAEYYYQIDDGSIVLDAVTGLFSSGSSTDSHAIGVLPTTPALYGTPIAVVGTDTYVRI